MKKTITLILIALMFLFAGCEEATNTPAMESQIMPAHKDWVTLYGDSDKSTLYYNLWRLNVWAIKATIEINKSTEQLKGLPGSAETPVKEE